MKRIYLYPNTKPRGIIEIDTGSPYVSYLRKVLEKSCKIENSNDLTSTGILNLLGYIGRVDVIFFNWIENLPDKRMGGVQSLLLLFLLPYLKVRKKTIVWILHNKISHSKKKIWMNNLIKKSLFKNASIIITHSREGINYALNNYSVRADLKYIPHPFMKEIKPASRHKIEFDIIIWGKILPYKGIDKFLDSIKTDNLVKSFKILIAGTMYPESYKAKLKSYQSENIIFMDRFIPDEELDNLINRSNVILFTYKTESILSSAALMDSLVFTDKIVIGPHVGAFADLAEDGLIYTYGNYKELQELLNDSAQLRPYTRERIKFISENTWENYGSKIIEWIEKSTG